MRVAVTGGTGFLGSALVRRLLARGDDVRVVVRPKSPHLDRLPPGVEVLAADLCDSDSLARALRDAEAVVHAAALVSSRKRPWREFERTNVTASLVLCRTAAELGLRRILYVSSFLVIGPARDRTGIDEGYSPNLRRARNHYQRSKMLAEVRLRELTERGLPIVIVYPGVLYGPGPMTEGNFVGRLINDFAAGRVAAVVGSGRQRWSFVHVDDVAEGIARAIHHPEAADRYVLGGENIALEDFLGLLAGLLGRPHPVRRLGRCSAWLVGFCSEVVGWLTSKPPLLTRGTAAIFRCDWALNSTAARRDLGYRFRPLAEGLAELCRGLLSPPRSAARGGGVS